MPLEKAYQVYLALYCSWWEYILWFSLLLLFILKLLTTSQNQFCNRRYLNFLEHLEYLNAFKCLRLQKWFRDKGEKYTFFFFKKKLELLRYYPPQKRTHLDAAGSTVARSHLLYLSWSIVRLSIYIYKHSNRYWHSNWYFWQFFFFFHWKYTMQPNNNNNIYIYIFLWRADNK